MNTFFKCLAVAAVAALPSVAQAAKTKGPIEMVCKVKGAEAGDWISPDILVQWTPGSKNAKVYDLVIEYFYGEPIDAKVIRDDKHILSVDWVLRNIKEPNGFSIDVFTYNMRFNKKTQKATFNARPNEFLNKFGGRGTCAEVSK
ncbi:MAG: hypothetical protein VX083_11660 [Pseudomonadota bacterium]|nr:hypothetical protein [Pseudomonadota bacterium]MEC8294146.1 hypothetical protein [Pseudomonadota bacterium]